MTKNKIKALLQIAKNLEDIAKEIKVDILEATTLDDCDDLIDELTSDFFEPEKVMSYMEENNYFENAKLADGDEVTVPNVSFNSDLVMFTIDIPVDDNVLQLSNSTADYNTQQASITYLKGEARDMIDLALVEIKKGELAVAHKLKADNKDIDIYSYGDVYDEDFTRHDRIAYSDIEKALNTDDD